MSATAVTSRIAPRARITVLEILGFVMLGVGLTWAFRNCVFVLQNYIRMPLLDHWSWIQLYYRSGLWRVMTRQHNEHRLFFPSLLFALDQVAGRGSNFLLTILLLAAQVLTFFIAWLPLRKVRELPRGMLAFLGGSTAVFALWFLQAENLFWPFQYALVSTLCFCIGAFYCFSKTLTQNSGSYEAGAIICAVVASFSFAFGMFVWPLLIAASLLNARKRMALRLIVGFVICVALYLRGYRTPVISKSPVWSIQHKPLSVIYYALLYLGRPFIPSARWDIAPELSRQAAAMGLIGLILCLGLVLRYVVARRREFDEHFYVLLALWALTTAFLTAVGRVTFPLGEVLGGRYVVVQILFWYGVIVSLLVIVVRKRLYWPLLQAEILGAIALACLLMYPSHQSMGSGYAGESKVLDQRASEALAGVFDPSEYAQEGLRYVLDALAALKRYHRGPFAFPESRIVGENISDYPVISGCTGYVDIASPTPDQHGMRLAGWAWGADNHPVSVIALVDADGRITGWGALGAPRPDVAAVFHDPDRASSGWVGYAPGVEPVRAFALSKDSKSACLLTMSH